MFDEREAHARVRNQRGADQGRNIGVRSDCGAVILEQILQPFLPAAAATSGADRTQHLADDLRHQFVAIGHIPIDRSGIDAQLLGKRAQAERLQALLIDKIERRLHDDLPVELRRILSLAAPQFGPAGLRCHSHLLDCIRLTWRKGAITLPGLATGCSIARPC